MDSHILHESKKYQNPARILVSDLTHAHSGQITRLNVSGAVVTNKQKVHPPTPNTQPQLICASVRWSRLRPRAVWPVRRWGWPPVPPPDTRQTSWWGWPPGWPTPGTPSLWQGSGASRQSQTGRKPARRASCCFPHWSDPGQTCDETFRIVIKRERKLRGEVS